MTTHDTHQHPATAGSILGAAGPGAAAPDLVSAHDDLHRAAHALREAVDHLHTSEDEAWKSYATEADAALARMEADLSVSAARLRAERAASKRELEEALEEAAGIVRGRIEELRVQAHVGQLDARDALTAALEDLGNVGDRLIVLADVVRHDAADTVSTLCARSRELFDDVRGALAGISIVTRH